MEVSGLISVIIPVYNVEEYLRECVDSVLSQTYENYEIILVDDGSTDNSGKICDEYAKNSKITVIHKENGGLSDTRNKGLELAKGEYIYFLDSDDFIVSETFEELVSAITKADADFVFFDSLSFEDEGRNYNIEQRYVRKNDYGTQNGAACLLELLKNRDYHSAVPLCFIKKKMLSNSGLRFVEGIYYEDSIFTYDLFMLSETVTHCKKAYYHRRYRKSSIMTSKKNKKYFDSICQVYESVLEFSQKENKIDSPVAKMYIARCAFNVFNNYEKLNKKDKALCKQKLHEIKKTILKNSAYDNRALKMRCYGKAFWFIYKVFEKTVGRLFR